MGGLVGPERTDVAGVVEVRLLALRERRSLRVLDRDGHAYATRAQRVEGLDDRGQVGRDFERPTHPAFLRRLEVEDADLDGQRPRSGRSRQRAHGRSGRRGLRRRREDRARRANAEIARGARDLQRVRRSVGRRLAPERHEEGATDLVDRLRQLVGRRDDLSARAIRDDEQRLVRPLEIEDGRRVQRPRDGDGRHLVDVRRAVREVRVGGSESEHHRRRAAPGEHVRGFGRDLRGFPPELVLELHRRQRVFRVVRREEHLAVDLGQIVVETVAAEIDDGGAVVGERRGPRVEA